MSVVQYMEHRSVYGIIVAWPRPVNRPCKFGPVQHEKPTETVVVQLRDLCQQVLYTIVDNIEIMLSITLMEERDPLSRAAGYPMMRRI
jgi:hypothetical protein